MYGDEASDHARVWKVYRDQAKEHDDKLLAGWHGSLDILLIFVRGCHLVLRHADEKVECSLRCSRPS